MTPQRITDLAGFNAVRESGLARLLPPKPRIAVRMGTCGSGNGAESVYHAFNDAISGRGSASTCRASDVSASAPRNRR